MTGSGMRKLSLDDIRRMKAKNELYHNPNAPAAEDLGPDFWAEAKIVKPREPRSVHLKVDAEVFDFFKKQGKGHLTRMQAVLKAYVNAHRNS